MTKFAGKIRMPAFFALLLLLGGCEEGKNINPRERAELEAIFAQARALDEVGRYHEALVRYEAILARRPEYMSTRLNAAMSAYDSGQYEKARGHFEILHKYGPGDWFVIRKLIQCCERLNDKEGIETYRKKLEKLRQHAEGSIVLKRYEGLTRDYIPIGSMHLIGYEFFDPKKHGRLWFFRLEDKNKAQISSFLLQATPFHDNSGKRMFSLTEACNGWLRIWHVGVEGREYDWTRQAVLDCLHGKRTPLVTKPLPPDYEALAAPDAPKPGETKNDPKGRKREEREEPAEETGQ
jgi:tetratricopeptide (TPR) repeat protein